MGKTQHFGLNKFVQGGTVADDGYKFTAKDRDIIDALLWKFMSHDHSEDDASRIANPSVYPDYELFTTGGSLPANTDRYYKIAYLDEYGNETAASYEIFVEVPDALTPPAAPTLVASTSAGSLAAGTYKYSVGYYQTLTTKKQTGAPSFAMTSLSATGQVTVTFPQRVENATGWDIYRKAPGDSAFYLVQTIAGQHEVQSLYHNGTAGSFTLTFDGEETAAIAYTADADDVRAALETLPGVGEVTVTGAGTSGDKWMITFITDADGYHYDDVPTMTADDSGLTGTCTIAVETAGQSLSWTDTGATADTGKRPPTANTTYNENKIRISIPDDDLPLDSRIAGWRIYRTNVSGVYQSNSLLATVSSTVTDGGDRLIDTYTDDGTVSLSQGVPLDQSAMPTGIPYVQNPLQWYCDTITFVGTQTWAKLTLRKDWTVRGIEAYMVQTPSGMDASNRLDVKLSDGTTTATLACTDNTGFYSWEPDYFTVTPEYGTMEADPDETDVTVTGSTQVTTDTTASGGEALRVYASASTVRWTIGAMTAGDYKFRFVVKAEEGDLPDFTLDVYDTGNTTSVATSDQNNYSTEEWAVIELSGTVGAGNNIYMEVTADDADDFYVDYFEYETNIADPPVFEAGSTLTLTTTKVGTPTDPGGQAQVTLW